MTRLGSDVLIAVLPIGVVYALIAAAAIQFGAPPLIVALVMVLSSVQVGGALYITVRRRYGLPTISVEVFSRVVVLSTVIIAASLGGTILGMQGHLAAAFSCAVVVALAAWRLRRATRELTIEEPAED